MQFEVQSLELMIAQKDIYATKLRNLLRPQRQLIVFVQSLSSWMHYMV